VSDLVSIDIFRAMVLLAAPLLLAALGELIAERSGILNLCLEGQMTLAAAVAFVTVYLMGSAPQSLLVGLLAGTITGVAVAFLFAFLTLTVRVDQISIGLSLLVLSLGAGALVYRLVVGVLFSPALIETAAVWPVPGLSDLPWLGPVLFQHSLFVYVALLAVIPIAWLLGSTRFGLLTRAAGENPKAVESAGQPLQSVRYSAVLVAGIGAGMAGSFFPLVVAGAYSDSIIGGRGWLAIMLVILGRWRPWSVFVGALAFAYLDSLAFTLAVTRPDIPTQFLKMVPYAAAIVIIAFAYRRAQFPAWLTRTYNREARV
jgi:general nucleoside transport system permease protein